MSSIWKKKSIPAKPPPPAPCLVYALCAVPVGDASCHTRHACLPLGRRTAFWASSTLEPLPLHMHHLPAALPWHSGEGENPSTLGSSQTVQLTTQERTGLSHVRSSFSLQHGSSKTLLSCMPLCPALPGQAGKKAQTGNLLPFTPPGGGGGQRRDSPPLFPSNFLSCLLPTQEPP